MQLRSDRFADGAGIAAEFAFGAQGDPFVPGGNRNPHLAWTDAPTGTRSFVLTCIDGDVPSRPDDVNQHGREVPADVPRVEFVHWLMANIVPECGELGAGTCSDGVAARGKHAPVGPPGSVQGRNSFTDWFVGDPDMAGDYLGYDGPCPPWNDSVVHRYRFAIHAIDLMALPLQAGFTLTELRQAMDGHRLARAQWVGTYTLNPRLT